MRLIAHSLLICAIAGFVSVANAQECKNGKCPTTLTATKTVQDGECKDGQCPIETAMGHLPKMEYKIGEKTTCCPKSAAAMAKESGSEMTFVVAKKEFQNKEKAYTHLVETTEKFVKTFGTPCKCEVSKTTTIAGKSCSCPIETAKRTKLVSTAMDNVKMSYKVGEKTCDCPLKAASLAKASGDNKEFVVGKECTTCEMTARLNLARAKYKAAVTALAKAEPKKEVKK